MVNAQAIKSHVRDQFGEFSYSKHREVVRLVYEIAKRENRDFRDILAAAAQESRQFSQIRQNLIARRFPQATQQSTVRPVLSELEIDSKNQIQLKHPPTLTPKYFVVEESLLESPLVERLKQEYPHVKMETISSYRDYTTKQKLTIAGYNRRLERFFIIRENYDFYKRCACSPKSVYCGYHIINLGSGCGFECAYCYLQDYINSPGIVIPGNIEDFFDQFENYKQDIRIGSGELTDSLIFDHITGFSPLIVNFFKKYPKSTFEFKTKSVNIANLLKVTPGNNIVVSWSMNPPEVIESTEYFTARLDERLKAAIQCMNAGYKLAFHFDPIIYYKSWEKDYKALVDRIFDEIDPERLAWISLGTLRMTTRLKKIIENRFDEHAILNEEFLPGHDDKLRYPFHIRTHMYQQIKKWIQRRKSDVYIYLCMEEKAACGVCETAPLKEFIKQPLHEGV